MPHTPLRHHRDRQRQLALQEPRITSRSPLADRQDRLCSAMWGSAAPVSAPSEGSFLDAKKGVGVRCDLTNSDGVFGTGTQIDITSLWSRSCSDVPRGPAQSS